MKSAKKKKKPAPKVRSGGEVLPWILAAVSVLLYALFSFSSLNKPLVDDEAEYGALGTAIAQTGQPIYYMGDVPEDYIPAKDRWIFKATPFPGFQYGLWHSPLYIYILGAFTKLFGASNWAARLPGALSFVAGYLLLSNILRMLLPKERAPLAIGAFSLFYLTNPLLVQMGLLVDIDTTVVPASTFLFLHEFIRMEVGGTRRIRKFAWLSLLLVIAFWSKEFTGIYIGGAMVGYYLMRRQWPEFLWSALSCVTATAAFVATWRLYCWIGHMPANYILAFTGSKLAAGEGLLSTTIRLSGLAAGLSVIWNSLLYIVVWESPFYFCLALICVGWRLAVIWKRRGPELVDILLIYAGLLFLATQVYRPSGILLRYAYPMHGVMLVLIAMFLCEICSQTKPSQWLVGAGLVTLISAAYVAKLGDPLLQLYRRGFASLNECGFWWFSIVALALILVASRVLWRKSSPLSLLVASLAISMSGFSLGQDWLQTQDYVTSFSYCYYGEKQHDEMANYLQSVLLPGELPICRKDVGAFLNRNFGTEFHRWYNPDVINNPTSAEELVRNITAPNVYHIVLDNFHFRNEAIPFIQQYYSLERQIGSFYLFSRKDAPRPFTPTAIRQ